MGTDILGLVSDLLAQLRYDPARPLLFNSELFLGTFLVFMAGYMIVHQRVWLRILYILLYSFFFYYKSSGWALGLLVGSALVNYLLGIWLYQSEENRQRQIVALGVILNLGLLAYFKYTNFLIGTFNPLLPVKVPEQDLFLPVGISFFTFQAISYLLDIRRQKIIPVRNPVEFLFYISFFPHLLAGPIVRASEFVHQIRQPVVVSPEALGRGLLLIAGGLFKKAVISDYISENLVDRVFEAPGLYSGLENVLGLYGFSLQIYCDFSGYTDMAIGIALLMGYQLPQNFRTPYQSAGIQEFWRRWHISLSSWLRDYLYISLGGNRKGGLRTYLNLMVTMLLGGLWHGASWQFVLWGALHGMALALDRMMQDGKAWLQDQLVLLLDRLDAYAVSRQHAVNDTRITLMRQLRWFLQGGFTLVVSVLYHLAGVMLTFHFVSFCWIFFRSASFEIATEMLGQLTTFFTQPINWAILAGYREVIMWMLLGYILHFLPEEVSRWAERRMVQMPVWAKSLALALVIWLVLITRSSEVNPFIYTQF
ncbi:MAG: MBOAT family O-acyltransferase [Bacteroidia bacterium]|nr:MBOAT family O-acyltransferase [Bacteroidia bacterium]